LNLYRPTQPRVLGVPGALVERGGFDTDPTNAWPLLRSDLGNDEAGRPVVPVVLDASTAIYSLHLKGVGSRLVIRDAADRSVTLGVVGLLRNSLLQGNVLVSEANFLRLFPDTGGYRYFLIEQVGPPSRGGPNRATTGASADVPLGSRHLRSAEITQLLETTLAADGFDATDAREQLAGFLAVQNTYLSTFQSLGALGLLLGTIGLAVVQLRSVLERRRELAVMRATGFRGSRLVRMVVWENAVLLLGGLAVGCMSAAVALVPQWVPHEASIPWGTLAVLLGTIAVVGLVAGWLATRSALRAPLVPALRGD
jgi:putative ABC transport system permease protein